MLNRDVLSGEMRKNRGQNAAGKTRMENKGLYNVFQYLEISLVTAFCHCPKMFPAILVQPHIVTAVYCFFLQLT